MISLLTFAAWMPANIFCFDPSGTGGSNPPRSARQCSKIRIFLKQNDSGSSLSVSDFTDPALQPAYVFFFDLFDRKLRPVFVLPPMQN